LTIKSSPTFLPHTYYLVDISIQQIIIFGLLIWSFPFTDKEDRDQRGEISYSRVTGKTEERAGPLG
jgi:hypothetical protein